MLGDNIVGTATGLCDRNAGEIKADTRESIATAMVKKWAIDNLWVFFVVIQA